MDEYIKREEIRRAYEKLARSYMHGEPYIADWKFDEMIEELPASDVILIRYAQWIQQPFNGTHIWHCSKCETIGSPQWNYCPRCGARMNSDSNG